MKRMVILLLFFFTPTVFAKAFNPEILCKKVHGTPYYARVATCRAGTHALKLDGLLKDELEMRCDIRFVCILIDGTRLNFFTPAGCGKWYPLCITCFSGANDPTIPKQYVFIPNV